MASKIIEYYFQDRVDILHCFLVRLFKQVRSALPYSYRYSLIEPCILFFQFFIEKIQELLEELKGTDSVDLGY